MPTTDPVLHQVERALDANDFVRVFELLEQALSKARNDRRRAEYLVEVAAVHALYSHEGLDGLQYCLNEAARFFPAIQQEPRFWALLAIAIAFDVDAPPWESVAETMSPAGSASSLPQPAAASAPSQANAASQTAVTAGTEAHFAERRADGLRYAREGLRGDANTRFYAATALATLGESVEALAALPAASDLPVYLAWRALGTRGGALEDMGLQREALAAYEEAAALTSGSDRAALLLDAAAMFLELEDAFAALSRLKEAERLVANQQGDGDGESEGALERASRLYLEARAHLMLDNPSLARERAELARRLETEAGEAGYGTTLVHAQALAALAQWPEALSAFSEAVKLAPASDQAYALHELAVAQMDADFPEEARESLQRALADGRYPFVGEVYADLAEVEYRLGRFDESAAAAHQALGLGAIIPASLMLANIAYEYYRLDEAMGHYERVVEEASEASREWVVAHEMIADVLVQMGWQQPERILHHAKIALPHLEPADEWAVTLAGYIQRAEQMLQDGSGSKLLN
jgi:tetratricopeptide (TPR) repeat protein